MLELYRTTSSFVTNGTQLTVHKVQGLSLATVTTTLSKSMFADGQGYVALSRATTPEQLFISQLDIDAIRADPDAIAEYRRLEAKAANFAAAAST